MGEIACVFMFCPVLTKEISSGSVDRGGTEADLSWLGPLGVKSVVHD